MASSLPECLAKLARDYASSDSDDSLIVSHVKHRRKRRVNVQLSSTVVPKQELLDDVRVTMESDIPSTLCPDVGHLIDTQPVDSKCGLDMSVACQSNNTSVENHVGTDAAVEDGVAGHTGRKIQVSVTGTIADALATLLDGSAAKHEIGGDDSMDMRPSPAVVRRCCGIQWTPVQRCGTCNMDLLILEDNPLEKAVEQVVHKPRAGLKRRRRVVIDSEESSPEPEAFTSRPPLTKSPIQHTLHSVRQIAKGKRRVVAGPSVSAESSRSHQTSPRSEVKKKIERRRDSIEATNQPKPVLPPKVRDNVEPRAAGMDIVSVPPRGIRPARVRQRSGNSQDPVQSSAAEKMRPQLSQLPATVTAPTSASLAVVEKQQPVVRQKRRPVTKSGPSVVGGNGVAISAQQRDAVPTTPKSRDVSASVGRKSNDGHGRVDSSKDDATRHKSATDAIKELGPMAGENGRPVTESDPLASKNDASPLVQHRRAVMTTPKRRQPVPRGSRSSSRSSVSLDVPRPAQHGDDYRRRRSSVGKFKLRRLRRRLTGSGRPLARGNADPVAAAIDLSPQRYLDVFGQGSIDGIMDPAFHPREIQAIWNKETSVFNKVLDCLDSLGEKEWILNMVQHMSGRFVVPSVTLWQIACRFCKNSLSMDVLARICKGSLNYTVAKDCADEPWDGRTDVFTEKNLAHIRCYRKLVKGHLFQPIVGQRNLRQYECHDSFSTGLMNSIGKTQVIRDTNHVSRIAMHKKHLKYHERGDNDLLLTFSSPMTLDQLVDNAIMPMYYETCPSCQNRVINCSLIRVLWSINYACFIALCYPTDDIPELLMGL